MTNLTKSIAAAVALIAVGGTAQAGTYDVERDATKSVKLNLCSETVQVDVQGDGKADLDFVIKTADGDILHNDADTTSFTTYTVQKAPGCREYRLLVRNTGNRRSTFDVTLTKQE